MTSIEGATEARREPVKYTDRAGVVFSVSLLVRILLASIFLGGADTMNALAAIPFAATHRFFYLPYFPIVQSILGATSPLVSHAHFVPIGLTVKLIPCIVDSLLSVWLLRNSRFDVRYRRSSAWLYAFCPLPLIMICLQGQWDSLWVLPAVTALALSDLLSDTAKARRTTLLLIGALLGLAVLSKPSALIIAGLLLPSFRYRKSVLGWIHDASLILTGAIATLVLFFLKFAANGIHIHQNIYDALEYGGQPIKTLFGLSNLAIFHHFSSAPAAVAGDFRQLAIFYVVAIAAYQLLARHPVDRMSAAAAAVLICPAIGGLAPDYLFWPLVFILASGRLRVASVYAVTSASVFFLYFLIPGASYNPGVDLGALLPLRSLTFLGLPVAAVKWFASPVATDVWHTLANLIVPRRHVRARGLSLVVASYRPFRVANTGARTTRVALHPHDRAVHGAHGAGRRWLRHGVVTQRERFDLLHHARRQSLRVHHSHILVASLVAALLLDDQASLPRHPERKLVGNDPRTGSTRHRDLGRLRASRVATNVHLLKVADEPAR